MPFMALPGDVLSKGYGEIGERRQAPIADSTLIGGELVVN
jgi:hypothetical protein